MLPKYFHTFAIRNSNTRTSRRRRRNPALSRSLQDKKKLAKDCSWRLSNCRKFEEHLATQEQAEAVMNAAVAARRQNQVRDRCSRKTENRRLVLAAQDDSVARLQDLLDRLKNHHIAAHLGIVAIAVILLWQFAPGTS